MKYTVTSAQANKLLRKFNEDYDALVQNEEQSASFVAALGEDVESVRPAYDFAATQAKLRELEEKIRTLKHAINRFNSETEVPGFGMTIDAVLVLIPQLNRRKGRLAEMKGALPKTRERLAGYGASGVAVDYRYANYEIAAAAEAYDAIADELSRAQTALDSVNNTVTFEVEV